MRLKELRKQVGLTQAELAKKLNVGQSTVAGWESEYRKIDSEMLQKLAELFGVTVGYILGAENKTPALPEQDGRDPEDAELDSLLPRLTRDQKRMLVAQLRLLADESK